MIDGEDLASAAVRYARDDCGLTIEVGEVVAELSGDRYRVLYEYGADTTYRATVFDAKLPNGNERAQSAMRAQWFAPAELATIYPDEFTTTALADLGLL